MLKLCRVTKVKVLFQVLVFVFNFDLFKFSAAILEKGLLFGIWPPSWGNSVAAVVRTRPRAIPLAMITMRKSLHGFPFLSYMSMGLRLAGRRSSALSFFRSEDEDDYEYKFSVLSMRIKFGGRHFSKCACSEQKIRTHSRPRPPI